MKPYDRLQLLKNDRIKTYEMSLISNSNSNSFTYYNLVVIYVVFLLLMLMVYSL